MSENLNPDISIDVLKIKNNLSFYELLGKNNFPLKNFPYIVLFSDDLISETIFSGDLIKL